MLFGEIVKTFDELEKQIIKKILYREGYARSLINLFDSQNNLQGTRIEIDKKNKKVSFLFQMAGAEPSTSECQFGIEKQKRLTERLVRYVNLFRFLEREELATFFDSVKEDDEPVVFGMGAVNMPSFCMSLDDQGIIDLLVKYVHKEVLPSPSLRQLESNGFRSDEEIRFRSMRLAAWAAIATSILIGLFGIYLNYLTIKTQQERSVDYRPVLKEMSVRIDSISKNVSALNPITSASPSVRKKGLKK